MSDGMTEEQLQEIKARKEAAQKMVSDLCKGRRQWIMSIPARRDYDPDMVIGDSLRDCGRLIKEVQRLQALVLESDE